jgi:hypothetical protein
MKEATMRYLFAIVIGFALAACSSLNIGSMNSAEAQRAVYAMGEAYKLVLQKAVEYESQPRCTATVTSKCSDPGIVAQLRKADTVASAALDAAQAAVRTPSVGGNAMSQAMQTANAALAALSALLPLMIGTP